MINTAPARADDGPTAHLKLADFEIDVPVGWELLKDDKTLLTIRNPRNGEQDLFLENLRAKAYPNPKNESLDAIFSVQFQDALKGFRVLDQGELTCASGRMRWMAISPKPPAEPDEDLVKIDYLITRADKLYVLHCMMRTPEYEMHRGTFERMAQSAKFTAPPAPDVANQPFDQLTPREQGRRVGQWTIYAMVAAALVFVLLSALRRRANRGGTRFD